MSKDRWSKAIPDFFDDLEQVTEALDLLGLRQTNLIVGIDFTSSNETQGKTSFNGKSLHATGNTPNPYEQAISVIGNRLSQFDEDGLIPCFGFGDDRTCDESVFSFHPNSTPCNGLDGVLARYKQILPCLKLYGPTSFAPVIKAAVDVVVKKNFQFHVLIIITDGQVTTDSNAAAGTLSKQERETIDAIVEASYYPLSIVVVGVGDGPWDTMQQFDDKLPARQFDNFQFVNFTKIMATSKTQLKKEIELAYNALMEVPTQYVLCRMLKQVGKSRRRPVGALVKDPPACSGGGRPT